MDLARNEQIRETLCEHLCRRIQRYKREHPRLSSQQVAKRFNISSSSFNRIENGDIKKPTIDQTLRILRGTGCTDILGYLDEYFPELGQTYREIYSNSLDGQFVDPSMECYFEDPEFFRIMLLAFSSKGVTRHEILDYFGVEGVVSLETLLNKDVLKENADGTIGSVKQLVNLSFNATKKLLINSIGKSTFGNSENNEIDFITYYAESVDLVKVSSEIREVISEAEIRIKEIMSNPNNMGKDYFYVGFAGSRLVRNQRSIK